MGKEATSFPFEQLERGGISKSGALKGLTAIPILSVCVYIMSPVVPNGLVAGRLLDPLVMVLRWVLCDIWRVLLYKHIRSHWGSLLSRG